MNLNNAVATSDTFNGFMQTTGTTSTVPLTTTTGNCWPYGNVTYWYSSPSYENKTERAYQVIRALMRAKVLRITTLDKFFDAMDEVVKAL